MSTIIAGRFEEEAKARHAPEVLEDSGFPAERITTFQFIERFIFIVFWLRFFVFILNFIIIVLRGFLLHN